MTKRQFWRRGFNMPRVSRQEREAIGVAKEMTVDDIAELAIRFDRTLVSLYTALAYQVSATRAQELLTRLAELEETVVTKQAWAPRTF